MRAGLGWFGSITAPVGSGITSMDQHSFTSCLPSADSSALLRTHPAITALRFQDNPGQFAVDVTVEPAQVHGHLAGLGLGQHAEPAVDEVVQLGGVVLVF